MRPIDAFKRAIETFEGGYQDDPADAGNITRADGIVVGTNRGVTPAAWAQYKGFSLESLTPADMKEITLQDAAELYEWSYYRVPGFDKLAWCPATEVWCDIAWHAGLRAAIKNMQRMVLAESDGRIGPETQAAFAAWLVERPMANAVNLIADWRCAFLKRLVTVRPANEKFLRGWLRRANHYRPANLKWYWGADVPANSTKDGD